MASNGTIELVGLLLLFLHIMLIFSLLVSRDNNKHLQSNWCGVDTIENMVSVRGIGWEEGSDHITITTDGQVAMIGIIIADGGNVYKYKKSK